LATLAACKACVEATPNAAPAFIELGEGFLPTDFDVQSKDVLPVDVDGDGDLDLLIAHEFRSNLLLINGGEGRFRIAVDWLPAVDRDSEDIAEADFDGDGAVDILFANEDDRVDELYLNDGSGIFAPAEFDGNGLSNATLTEDVDGNGTPDILLGNRSGVSVWLGDGRGGFVEDSSNWIDVQTIMVQDLELGDVDGDGDQDLVVASDGENAIYLRGESGKFTLLREAIPRRDTSEQTREADFGDIDGDGDLDLYFANVAFGGPGDATDRLLINDGTGRFVEIAGDRLPVDDGSIMTMDADLVDIDRDGDVDIALTGLTLDRGLAPAELRILLNDGTGIFSYSQKPLFQNPIQLVGTDIEFADFNGDGTLDLYLANRAGPDRMFMGMER